MERGRVSTRLCRVKRILYESEPVRPMGEGDLAEILTVSRANNARDGLSGMLLYLDEFDESMLSAPRFIHFAH